MQTKTKLWLGGILAALALLLFLVPPFVTLFGMKPVYTHTFYGRLNEKHDYLERVEGPKVVIVGGSSVAFGLDSPTLQETVGMQVVNFGLYADLGTKIMMELAEDDVGEGDIVVLAPEVDEQTLSLYFNGLSSLKALDDDPSMAFELDGDDWEKLWGSLWTYMGEKWDYAREGLPDPAGVYNAANFNEWGDVIYPRPENVMPGMYDKGKTIYLEERAYDPAFVDYVNDFTARMEKKGARVFYTFCPINALSVSYESVPEGTEDGLAYLSETLLAYLEGALDCEILGTPAEAVMNEAYFYDSNVHLNDTGVPVNTARLSDYLCELLGRPCTARQRAGYRWQEGDFRFVMNADGTCELCGVEGLAAKVGTMVLPAATEAGPEIVGIRENAFAGCNNLITLVMAPGSRIREVSAGAFGGLGGVSSLFCYAETPLTSFPRPSDTFSCYFGADVFAAQKSGGGFAAFPDGKLAQTVVPFAQMEEVWHGQLEELSHVEPIRGEDDYFVFESIDNGENWMIVDLTEAGRTVPVLTIPNTYYDEATGTEGKVASVEAYAFAEATGVLGVIVPEDSRLDGIVPYAFSGSSVQGLYMFCPVENLSNVAQRGMVAGVVADFRIWVGNGYLPAYKNNYGWSAFAGNNDDFYRECTEGEWEVTLRLLDASESGDEPSGAGSDAPARILAGIAAGAAILVTVGVGVWVSAAQAKKEKKENEG